MRAQAITVTHPLVARLGDSCPSGYHHFLSVFSDYFKHGLRRLDVVMISDRCGTGMIELEIGGQRTHSTTLCKGWLYSQALPITDIFGVIIPSFK